MCVGQKRVIHHVPMVEGMILKKVKLAGYVDIMAINRSANPHRILLFSFQWHAFDEGRSAILDKL